MKKTLYVAVQLDDKKDDQKKDEKKLSVNPLKTEPSQENRPKAGKSV